MTAGPPDPPGYPDPWGPATAFYSPRSRVGQAHRLHIHRGDGAWCPATAHDTRRSTKIRIPLPATPPTGLTWCPTCVARRNAQTATPGDST